MTSQSTLHSQGFRENERAWNDIAQLPIALFIGLSPPGIYFRCFIRHSEEVDCSRLSPSPNSFLNTIIEVTTLSGVEVTGTSKEEKVKSLSESICVVDFFDSVSGMRKSLKRFRRGEVFDEVVELSAVEAVKQIVERCASQGQRLPVIAALGPCIKPDGDSGVGCGQREFRWCLWNSLQRQVEREFGEDVMFMRWDGAHLFGAHQARAEWVSRVREGLLEIAREAR